MKIAASSLFSTSFPSLSISLGSTAKKSEVDDKAKEDPESKRLKDLKESLRRLEVGMTPKQMAKKASSEKIGMLQRRLMELKQLLLHATPEQARALARELKSIAGELASAAKAAGGTSGGGQETSGLTPVVSGADAASTSSGSEAASAANSAEAAQGADAQAAEGTAAEARQAADATASQGNNAASVQADQEAERDISLGLSEDKRSDDSPDSIEIPDKVLKDMLNEARKLLKEVIDMAKLKMGHGDKESRNNLEEAEKKLQDIGFNTETQVASAGFYTSQGMGMPDIGSLGGTASTGTNISVEA